MILSLGPIAGQAASHFIESPVAACFINSLEAFEESKESLPEFVALPDSVELSELRRSDARYNYNVGVNWFRSHWQAKELKRLRELAQKAARGEIAPGELNAIGQEIKQIRSSVKFLRFLFTALSDDHEVPEALDELATAVGKLKDGLKRLDSSQWPPLAKRVLRATRSRAIKEVDQEISDFRPASRQDFKKWLKKNLQEAEAILAAGSGTGNAWHQARKNLQAVLAVYQLELQKDPSNLELRKIVSYLLKQTELMGDEVGAHEDAVLMNGLNYNKDAVPFPGALAADVLKFIRLALKPLNSGI